MKISQQPTDHILVRANCQSEWDNCDFAIVVLGKPWKDTMKKRLDAAESFFSDYDFRHFTYLDDSVSFYVSKEDEADALFAEAESKEWIFVALDEDEEESFVIPENRLEAHSMLLYKNGAGLYKAYGKHTGEGFYTEILPFKEILDNMLNHKK